MYFEDIALVIMNPNWFCNHIIGNILHQCSNPRKYFPSAENGIISHEDFDELCTQVLGLKFCEDIYEIMNRLQICYEDLNDKIMIPSLLRNEQDSMDWSKAFYSRAQPLNYVGTKLISNDGSITLPTEGFYPRLQVYLHGKFDSTSYKISKNIIAFIYNGINVFITRNDGINIMTRSTGAGVGDHALHKMIIKHINDLRRKPTLGCPGVVFEEHSIWPSCVEHPFRGRLQSVSKKHLKEMMLRTGDLKFAHQWRDDEHRSDFSHASELLGDEEWQSILESRAHMVKEMDKVLDRRLVLASSGDEHSPNSRTCDREAESSDSGPPQVLAKLDSMKRLIQCNHKEVMERLNAMETRIIRSQEALAARVCSNVDHLLECSLQLKNSKIPKLPFLMKFDEKRRRKHILLEMVADLTTCHLHFRCEHNDHGFHTVDDQHGCEIRIGTDKTRKLGTVMFWGLTISTMLLKVGAHLGAGMGSMVPDLAGAFATILDTPGLLDLTQPKGRILECLPAEFKENPIISLHDNEQAKDWLVKLLGTERQSKSMYDMFKLTEVVYTSNSNKRQEVGWVCDAHKP